MAELPYCNKAGQEEITRLRSRIEELESACANAHDQLCLLAKDPANNPWCKELREVLKENGWAKRLDVAIDRSVLNNTQIPLDLVLVPENRFNPNWTLPLVDHLAGKLSIALHKYIPHWPGATDEELAAVAEYLVPKEQA